MQYDLNLSPGASQRIEATGRFIKYVSGTGKIRVTLNTGASIELTPGQGVTGVNFAGLTIADRSGAINVGVLLAGEFEFRDDTMQATVNGSVTVVESGTNRVMEGNRFIGVAHTGTAGSLYHFGSLENPAGSGKLVIVDNVLYSHVPGGAAGVMLHLMAAPTEVACPTLAGSLTNGINKRGVTGVADTSTATLSGRSGAGGSAPFPKPFLETWANGDSRLSIEFKEPIIVRPGFCMVARCATINAESMTTFEFREEQAV